MSNNATPLPLLRIFLQTLILSKRRFADIVVVSSPFLFLAAVGVAAYVVFYDVEGSVFDAFNTPAASTEEVEERVNQVPAIYFLLLLVWLIALVGAYVVASVGCYRIFLLGLLHNEKTIVMRWTWEREGTFLLWEFMLGAVFGIGALFIASAVGLANETAAGVSFYQELLFLLSSLPLALLVVRCFMLFPAIATERPHSDIKWSWNLTAGNSWRLALLLFVLPALFEMLVGGLLRRGEGVVYDVLVVAVIVFARFIEIGLLSLCYYYLQQESAEAKAVRNIDGV